ncbi:hypothetical protein N3K66_002535 [Trichothecium roseum]|uniref:Uncharacterized protein n=1 Tax=Trichothecium roseum TaxID=47278 RepID=A0ACC0VBP2_9HYPO|nr:hypothetical protein N3K66_002535 [Trichothecium roseum]
MVTTRKSTAASRGPTKGQSVLPFSNKVTKNIPRDVKRSVISPAAEKIEKVEPVVEEKPAKNVEEAAADPAEEAEEEPEEEVEVEVPHKSEAELKAEKTTDAQIRKYWKGIEKERISFSIHQQGQSVNEKVLRYFDVSSQYGPCIGIDRTKRWQRAERLGLEPPIEVLAVLLKEREQNHETETAQMDKILNSIIVGAAEA